jgi:hypothetical protein
MGLSVFAFTVVRSHSVFEPFANQHSATGMGCA